MPELIEWRDGVVRATRDLTHDIRMFEIAPSGEFVVAGAGQPYQCRRPDRRTAGRAQLFHRRPLHGRLSDRRQAA